MRYEYFILVIPATMHKASSGTPGKTNRIGNKILDFLSMRFWADSNSCLEINFVANFSPSLSPTKNNSVFANNVAIRQDKKATCIGNIVIARIARDVFSSGTKQRRVRIKDESKIYTRIAKPLDLFIISFKLLMFVIPHAFKIK